MLLFHTKQGKAMVTAKNWWLCLGFIATQAWAADQPGTMHHIKASELPKPFATPAVDNSSHLVPRPKDAMPLVPKGFQISIYASGLTQPRFMELAPNGDVFLSEPDAGK